MTFTSVIHLALLIPLGLVAVGLTVWGLIGARGAEQRVRWSVRVAMVLALFAVMLRPGVPGGSAASYATDADVLLVVDTTASVIAEDWDGDEPRLDGIRDDVDEIVKQYPGARFSLITFDSTTSVRLPLTTDTAALDSAMEVLRPEPTGQSKGSSVTEARGVLRDVLAGAAKSGRDRSRMVFYFGDGEQTSGLPLDSMRAGAKYIDAGRVLGYGTKAGGAMRETLTAGEGGATGGAGSDDADGGYLMYQGERAMSVIDEKNLKAVAGDLGIEYEHRSAKVKLQLPEVPPSAQRRQSGEVGNVIDLSGIPAGAAALALAVELAYVIRALMRLRSLRRDEERATR